MSKEKVHLRLPAGRDVRDIDRDWISLGIFYNDLRRLYDYLVKEGVISDIGFKQMSFRVSNTKVSEDGAAELFVDGAFSNKYLLQVSVGERELTIDSPTFLEN